MKMQVFLRIGILLFFFFFFFFCFCIFTDKTSRVGCLNRVGRVSGNTYFFTPAESQWNRDSKFIYARIYFFIIIIIYVFGVSKSNFSDDFIYISLHF